MRALIMACYIFHYNGFYEMDAHDFIVNLFTVVLLASILSSFWTGRRFEFLQSDSIRYAMMTTI